MNQLARADSRAIGALVELMALGRTNDLLVKRFELEARASIAKRSGDLSMWYLVLCLTSAVQGRADEAIQAADAAVTLAPNDIAIVGNVSSTLGNIGEAVAALPYVRTLATLGDADHKRSVISALGVLRKALCFEEVEEMTATYSLKDNPFQAATARLLDARIRRDLSVETRQLMLRTAVDAVRAQGYTIRQTFLAQCDDDLRYELYIDESPVRCGEVNFAIAEALCERFEDPAPEAITFACRPLSSYKFEGEFITVIR